MNPKTKSTGKSKSSKTRKLAAQVVSPQPGFPIEIGGDKRAEEALRISESSLLAVLQSTADGILAIGSENEVLFANERFEKLWRIPPAVMASKDDSILLQYILDQLSDPQSFLKKVQELYKSKEESFDTLNFKDGRVFERQSRPFMQGAGVHGRVWSFRDITERKQIEEKLEQDRILLRTLIDNLPDRIYVMDVQGRKIISNMADWQASGGKTMEDIIGKTDLDTYPPELAQDFWAVDKSVIDSGIPIINREEAGLDSQGKPVSVLSTKVPLRDGQGKIIGLVGTGRDITDRKQAEEALRQSEAELRALFASMHDAVLVIDRAGVYRKIAPTNPELLVIPPQELLGKNVRDFFPFEQAETFINVMQQVLDTKQTAQIEYDITIGELTVQFETSISPMTADSTLWVARDITGRKRAEAALTEERHLLSTLLDSLPDHIYFKDRHSRFTHLSESQAKRFGLNDPAEALGKTDFDFFTEEHARSAFEVEQKIIATGQPVIDLEEKETSPDGRVTWVNTTKMPLLDQAGNIIGTFGISSDITEHKQAEEALAQERNLLRSLIDNVPDYIYVKDSQSRFMVANTALAHLVGASTPEDLLGKTDFDFFPQELAAKYFADDQALFKTGQALLECEERTLDNAGNSRWISTTKVPLRDTQGKIFGLVGMGREMTDRKQAKEELQASQAAERNFARRLTILSETTTELSKADSLDALCRRAVELGRERLDFDRLAIFFLSEDSVFILGTFGVDAGGRITDERGDRYPVGYESNIWSILQSQIPLLRLTDVPLALKGKDVGQGTHVYAGLWDGNTAIGFISVDNLLRQRPISDRDCEIIRLYASALGHLCSLKRAQEKLRTSEERFTKSFQSNPIATIIDILPEGRLLDVNETFLRLTGYSRQEVIGKTSLELNLWANPEDRIRFAQGLIEQQSLRDVESQLLKKSGENLHVLASAEIIEIAGQPHGLIMLSDITGRKRNELVQNAIYRITQAAITSEGVEALYHSIHSILGELIPAENFFIALIEPASGEISFPYYVDQFDEPPVGMTPQQGLTGYIIRTGRPLLATREEIERLVQQGQVERLGAMSVDWMGAPLKVEGRMIGVMAVQSYTDGICFNQEDLNLLEFVSTQVAQAIERKRMEQEIRNLSMTDDLTGLYNRRGFTLLAEQEVKLAHRIKRSMLLFFGDVDSLKTINDTHGHAQGDLALNDVSAILKETFREADIMARIGGDEFVVLAVDATMESTDVLTNRIQSILERRNQQGDRPYQLSLSLGIAHYDPEAPCTVSELIAQADDRMYQQKRARKGK